MSGGGCFPKWKVPGSNWSPGKGTQWLRKESVSALEKASLSQRRGAGGFQSLQSQVGHPMSDATSKPLGTGLQMVWGAGHHSPCRAHPGWAPRAEPTREKSAAAEGRCLSPPDRTGLELGRMRVICSSFCSSHKSRTPDWASHRAGPWQGQRHSTGDVGWPPAAPSARRETDPRGVGSGNRQDTGDLPTPLMCSLSSMLGESGRG